MAAASTKVGHTLAKGLGIHVDYRHDATESLSRGESVTSSVSSTNGYFVEEEPTAGEWLREVLPNGSTFKNYFKELFPFVAWITRYNTTWLLGDIIAGLTVGAVVVPQGMAYALLAKLPPEYGLYTSFVGFFLYWAFATSKDITIGTVAVMSTIVGNIVIKVQSEHPDIPAEEIARTLALISGSIVLFIGLARIGWIVEWIPLTAITAFMTGSAISIAVGQVPALMGISGVNTRDATYLVFINTLKALGGTKLDAAMGLSALAMLYLIRSAFNWVTPRFPNHKRLFFFLSTLRIAFVILLYTLISWLVNRNVKDAKKAAFKILGTIPRGFQHAGAPKVNTRTISAFVGDLPATVIVMLIEHIAISKSFGRINNYTINPSQELVAIGFTNVLGPFLGGYPATGSFSRTAIKSKAGVRTPLAGVFTAVVVLLALYALTAVFFFIPLSSLSAVIIHAVGDLITPPNVVFQFWEVSPLEVPVFFLGVFVTIFTSIENGIYVTIAASAAIVLFRISKAGGRFLGRVRVHSVPSDDFAKEEKNSLGAGSSRDVFVPLDRQDGSNPDVKVESPYPGIFIYRFSEGFNYPNSGHYLDQFTKHIFEETRRGTLNAYAKLGDRPWNDPGPRRGQQIDLSTDKPILRAIILDFSAVNNVDVSSIQNLVDVRAQLDRYAAPHTVGWHVACVTNRWTRRALASAGFGYPKSSSTHVWKPILSVADVVTNEDAQHDKKKDDVEHQQTLAGDEITQHIISEKSQVSVEEKGAVILSGKAPLYGVNRPFFHVDVVSALESAAAALEASVSEKVQAESKEE